MFTSEIIIDHAYKGMNPVQFGYEDCEPSHSFGPAVRTHWLLHYIVSGKGIFERDGKQYSLRSGDIFIIPPYIETYYEADSDNPWKYIWIGFTADFDPSQIFSGCVIHNSAAESVFEDMKRCHRMENGKSAFLAGKLWELVSILQEQNKSEYDYVEKAVSCMNSEYTTGITVQEIATRLNLDRSYFSTIFKERYGIPPQRYLLNLRLERAAELMTAYNEAPSIACVSVGFTDLYHFSKIFKQHFGMSPRAYIKSHKGE